MITKLTALALSGIMTVGLVAAAAPTVTTQQQLEQQIAVMTNACRQGYTNYRYGKQDAQTALQDVLQKFPVEQRSAVALICIGYGEGYEDGRRGIS